MELELMGMIITELTISLKYHDGSACWYSLRKEGCDVVWCNGGNCKMIKADQIEELIRVAELTEQLMDETEIKKGPPPQHRIFWDDCPKVPDDLSQLLNNKTGD